MRRMSFDPNDYTDDGVSKNINFIIVIVGAFLLFLVFYSASYYYFAHTDYKIFNNPPSLNVIAIILSFVEIGVIYHIRNGKKDLAKYSESEYDSQGGCMLLIALIICSVFFNCILINEVNGRLDFSQATKREAKIVEKHHRARSRKTNSFYQYYFIVEDCNNNSGRLEFEVTESMYNSFRVYDKIEFETKSGLLGYEHISSEIRSSKD